MADILSDAELADYEADANTVADREPSSEHVLTLIRSHRALSEKAARLEREVEAAERAHRALDVAIFRNVQALAQAQEALAKYGEHAYTCPRWQATASDVRGACNCGLAQALAGQPVAPPPAKDGATADAVPVVDRGQPVHELKCWLPYFEAVRTGEKPFEVRKNDRDYRVGDVLRLREYDAGHGRYTGREHDARVTSMLLGGAFGVEHGYCVLGLAAVSSPVPAEPDEEKCECGASKGDVSFDRSICACGSMHYFCNQCGAQSDECQDDAASPVPVDGAERQDEDPGLALGKSGFVRRVALEGLAAGIEHAEGCPAIPVHGIVDRCACGAMSWPATVPQAVDGAEPTEGEA